MTLRGLLLVPFVLVSAIGPGLFFVRRLRWTPLEQLAGSIALSLLMLAELTLLVYWAGLPHSAYYAITAIAGALTLAAAPDAWRLLRVPSVRRTAAAFVLLAAWTLGTQSVIRHYSGGDWCCDWVEHYQRTLFFLERWPKNFLFINRYTLTARPPFMNLMAAYFLGNVGEDFAFYQIVFSLLNLLAFVPCCLLARQFAPRVRQLPALVAIFLACNPTFFMNTTFAWTKALTAFFVILAVWFFLAGWRRQDSSRMSAAFLCLAAGMLVHFSAGPYALVLAGIYVGMVLPGQRRPARALAIVALPAAAVLGVWLTWSVAEQGTSATLTQNPSVEFTSAMSLEDNVVRISLNAFHTFRPYLFPSRPEDSPLRRLIDRAFTFYQENFLGAIGSVNAWVAFWLVGSAVWPKRSRLPDRERRFWLAFVPLTLLVGIAVDGEVSPSGVANICLQPLAYLAVTLVASRYLTFGRVARIVVWCGVLTDFILGVALEMYMESRMQTWARTPNWDWKASHHLVFLGDVLRRSAPSIGLALAVGATCALGYLGRAALATRST